MSFDTAQTSSGWALRRFARRDVKLVSKRLDNVPKGFSMGRPANPLQLSALQHIRQCIAEHGEELGPRIARAAFPTISKPSWHRYVSQVRAEDARFEEAVPVAPSMPATEPQVRAERAVPLSPAETFTVEPSHAIDFFRQLAIMLEDADMLRAYAAPVDPATGVRKVRNPMMLVQATKLRALTLGLVQRHAEAAWNVEAVQSQIEEIMSAVCKALVESGNRDLSQRVIGDLQALSARWDARLNFYRPAGLGAA